MKTTHTKDMTVGTPWKLIAGFAFPVFLSHVFQQLYNTADSLIVGKYLGTESLAAVSSSGPLIFLMVSFFTGTAMGAGVVISKYFGAKDDNAVSKGVHTAYALGIISGILITLLGLGFTPTLLRLMNTDADILPEAIQYFSVYFCGSLFVVLYNISTGIMNAVGNSRRPLYYLVMSSVMNLLLDFLFIGVFRWGVWAAALATVISQVFSAVLCFVYLLRVDSVCRLSLSKLRIHRDTLGEILRYGLPAGIQNSVIALANVLVQTNINSFGKEATAAYGSYAKLEGFAFLPITSFTMALTTFTGQNLGAGQYDRAKKGSRFGILCAVVLAEIIGILFFLLAPTLIGLFSNDPTVIAYGVRQAKTESLFYCLLAFSHAVAAVCRGAGKAFVPMSIMLSVWCILRISYITLVMHFVHEIGMIYWAYPLTWGISSVIYFFYYFCSDWIHGFERQKEKRAAKALKSSS